MTPVERELLVLVARHVAGHIAPSVGAEGLRERARTVEMVADRPTENAHTVTSTDLRAVLALVADVAAVCAGTAANLGDLGPELQRAEETIDAAHRMAASLGEPERTP